jgi:hypothetical protein
MKKAIALFVALSSCSPNKREVVLSETDCWARVTPGTYVRGRGWFYVNGIIAAVYSRNCPGGSLVVVAPRSFIEAQWKYADSVILNSRNVIALTVPVEFVGRIEGTKDRPDLALTGIRRTGPVELRVDPHPEGDMHPR